MLRTEFNTTLKLVKKTIRKSKSKDEHTKEDAIKKAKAVITSKDKHLQDIIALIEQKWEKPTEN